MRGSFLTIFVTAFVLTTKHTDGAGISQMDLDRLADSLNISCKILENYYNNTLLNRFRITLRNAGASPLPETGWALYFHRFYMLFPDVFPKERNFVMEKEKIRVSMIHGDLYSLEPADGFGQIGVGEARDIDMTAQYWSVSRTDFMPNWYVVSSDPNVKPRILTSTTSPTLDYVEPFTEEKQWKRYENDQYNPFSPRDRFNRLKVEDTQTADKLVIPTPKSLYIDDGQPKMAVDYTWSIYGEADNISSILDTLAEETQLSISRTQAGSKIIHLAIDNKVGKTSAAYSLQTNTTSRQIFLKGNSFDGLFYAVQSLLSILYHYSNRDIPQMTITDEPRFEYRGFFLDMSRHFHSVEDVKKLMRTMAMYKLNKLHLHLGDDEGWRLEIPELPELTEVGGNRCHDLEERWCIIPQYGSGPRNDTSGSGFLTVDQYKDLLTYAVRHHIEVIPEFDMPGHAHAAIKSMEERDRRLMQDGQQEAAEEFLLSEADDRSEYKSVQQWTDNAVNPCQESTYRFIGHLLDKVKEMHKDIQPLKTYHFGGDEVANGAWEKSPICKSLLQKLPVYNVNKGLKKYFAQRVANLTASRGLALRGWEDGFVDGDGAPFLLTEMDNKHLSSNAWDNVWEWGAADRAYRFANAGYKVVMSQATHLYYDHPYEPDPEERGLYWATRFTDTWKTFGFIPDDLYANIDTKRSGEPISKSEVCKDDMSACAVLQRPENIIGMQGHLWSENIHNSDHMDYMIFPRLLALAERAWHKADFEQNGLGLSPRQQRMQKEWQAFANTLGHKELRRLDEIGVKYRVPPPGARYQDGTVEVSTTFPGLPIQYKGSRDTTWKNVKEQRFKWSEEKILLRTLSSNTMRQSRVIEVTKAPFTQAMLDTLANNLTIKAKVLDNLLDNAVSHKIRLTLMNNGKANLPNDGWALYFHSFFILYPNVFPKQRSIELPIEKIRINMIQGDLYSLEPIAGFVSLAPNESRFYDIQVAVWSVQKTDFMPNWYVAASGSSDSLIEPRIVESTKTLDFVEPFEDPRQWKRFNFDKFNPFTAAERYERLHVENERKAVKLIIPTPKDIEVSNEETLSIDSSWKIFNATSDDNIAAEYLADLIKLSIVHAELPTKMIKLVIDATLYGPSGSYTMDINPQTLLIELKGKDKSGLFYAVSSLASLLSGNNNRTIPRITINDEPRYEYRGFYLDMSRHFHSVEDVKRLMRTMAMYKLNKLHLHLGDDEGWRLEIPELPELTETGGNRCHDLEERRCIIPQYGSGPRNDTSGSGFLTVNQYKDLLTYAVRHHIEVIPEFDMPGHAHAAIKSMKERYRRLMQDGKQEAAEEFLLSEADDNSEYMSVQQWTDNAVNPCQESTYRFIGHLLDKVKEMHKDIQPLKTYHFGGDEVANGAWEKSPKCKSLLQELPMYNVSKGLKKYFAQRVANLTVSQGLALRGWEDGFVDGDGAPFPLTEMDNKHLSSNAWDNVWEWGAADRAYRFANAGYKVVMSQATHLYYDHPYEPDHQERGLYWATRFVDTWKTFGFLPDDLYENIQIRRSGEKITKDDICGANMSKCAALHIISAANIIGMQGHLWSENIHNSDHMDYMIFPRLLALAERAWHKADFEQAGLNSSTRQQLLHNDWQAFANTLGHKELQRMDEMGVKYRVPPPGARFDGNTVSVSSTFPGLPVQFKRGSEWIDVPQSGSIADVDHVMLRTLSADRQRASRVIEAVKDDGLPWTDQPVVDYIAANLGVQLVVVDNTVKINNSVQIRLQLANKGNQHIPSGNWRINFYSLYGVLLETLSCGLRVGHVDGALYYLTPSSSSFEGISPHKTLTCIYYNKHWLVSRTDVFPNWFISALGMQGKTIESTASEKLDFVGNFDTEKQWKRSTEDKFNPYSPDKRYSMYDLDLPHVEPQNVIPTPANLTKHSAHMLGVTATEGWTVVKSEEFSFEARYLADKLGLDSVEGPPKAKFIVFHKIDSVSPDESYKLNVNPDTNMINITAKHGKGALNAVQTLISLSVRGNDRVPHVSIEDTPRFSYRGVMLDVARSFKPKEWVFKFLDTMSMYKLNRLHFHLTDDEGWRVEIPGIPELTQVGGLRCNSDYNDTCTTPQLGSGPGTDNLGSGFYTMAEYRDILQYANDRHILVIPEVDTPIHSTAAVVAMAAREKRLNEANMHHTENREESYRLSDVEYTGGDETLKKWRHALSPCLYSTYSFLDKVLDGFIELHRPVQKLETFHIGGDELVDGQWDASPSCKESPLSGNTSQLQRMFVKRFADLVAQKGLNLAAWEDGIYADDKPNPLSDYNSSEVYAYTWNSRWEPNSSAKRVSEFADAGYKVVMPLSTHLYLDHPYEPDPEERGLYWASRDTDEHKVYSFMPDDVFANADVDRFGVPVNMTVVCGGLPCPKPSKPENIIGIQAIFFTETLKTEEQFEYMAFPRLLAMAERAWHKASWENIPDVTQRNIEREKQWNKFRNNLGKYELSRLENNNILYRVPPPGARMNGQYLEVNTLFPGLVVEFSLDNGITWSDVGGARRFLRPGYYTVQVRAKSSVLNRVSRAVQLSTVIVSSGPTFSPVLALIATLSCIVCVMMSVSSTVV